MQKKRRRSRTKLKDRPLPTYTKGEEVFNMVSHIVGGAIGVAALVLCNEKKGRTASAALPRFYNNSLIFARRASRESGVQPDCSSR